MGAPDEVTEAPRATTAELQPDDEPVHINHEHAERMDGAFLSIVFSAALPCGLVIVVTAILLGVIFGKRVDSYRGWPELHIVQNDSSTATGVWATLNGWKNFGGDAALFVKFNPSSLTAIAALTGKIIPYLSSSIMALVAFFVARRIILISKEGRDHELPTSHQMSLLIQLLGGSSYGPLKDTVHYHIKHKKRWVSPIPHAFSALAAVTALGLIIPAADTWFSTTVTPVKVAVVEKVTNGSNAYFGRGISSSSNPCLDELYWTDGNNPWRIPCSMVHYYYERAINIPLNWTYSVVDANEASLAIANLSVTNTVNQWAAPNDTDHVYKYMADKRMDATKDFRARTLALKTQCAPMTSSCFPSALANSNDIDTYGNLGANHSFSCSPGFTGDLTSNGASLATGLRANSSISAGIGYAPDANLSRMVGNNASLVEFAAFTNPLYFGAWSIGWKIRPEADFDGPGPGNVDPWDYDSQIYYDENQYYAWMLNCSMEIYTVEYDWVNGTTQNFFPQLADAAFGGMFSYPFASGLGIAQLCTDMTASKVQKASDSGTLANWWADYFSSCAMDMMAGTLDPIITELEQTRNNNFGATRVPIVPLFVLLGLKFLYCFAVLCLAVAAYHYANPVETQSVKERLTVKGLAATYFCDSPSHQQVAVRDVEQLFQPSTKAPAADDAEAAAPTESKIGMVQTDLGGWQFVKMAASKVYDTVSPILEKELMSDASAGNFGKDGTEAANWISLVKK